MFVSPVLPPFAMFVPARHLRRGLTLRDCSPLRHGMIERLQYFANVQDQPVLLAEAEAHASPLVHHNTLRFEYPKCAIHIQDVSDGRFIKVGYDTFNIDHNDRAENMHEQQRQRPILVPEGVADSYMETLCRGVGGVRA
jgi:hypothetical protein